MESKSDISSISSQQNLNKSIPSIHLQEFILDQHARNISSLYTEASRRNYPRIFTVAETLKDPLILNHIKPDYGSLGEFIGDINISKDLLNQKKRKNDTNQQQIEQKKTRAILKQKNHEELNNIYLNKNTSAIFKKVAGKLLVQNLFKDSFGVSLNAFETQNVKPETPKNNRINLSAIDEIFMGKKNSMVNMEASTHKKQLKDGEQEEELKASKLKGNQSKKWTKSETLDIIEALKLRYPSLKKLEIKQTCPMYQALLPRSNDEDFESSRTAQEQADRSKIPSHVIQINESKFNIEKLNLKPELVIYFMSQFPLHKLQYISLYQVRISEETLSFMLDVIKTFSKKLAHLSLRNISIQKTQGIATKIKQILECLPLKQLNLECMDLETKDFCIICLGIGTNNTLQMLNFDNNGVDERGSKSLELISKHCQKLKKISLRKNFLQPHHLSYYPVQAKSKIIL